jgi:hypothetical protein
MYRVNILKLHLNRIHCMANSTLPGKNGKCGLLVTVIWCLQASFSLSIHNVQQFLIYLLVNKSTSIVFEILTVVVIKSSVFWDITPCSPFKVNQHFGGTCHLHFQGRSISLVRNQCEAGTKKSKETSKKQVVSRALLATCFILFFSLAYSLSLKMEETCSPETSVDFQWTVWYYIPEARTLQEYVLSLLAKISSLQLIVCICHVLCQNFGATSKVLYIFLFSSVIYL